MGGEFLSVREVAERLHLSTRRAYVLCDTGIVPSVRMGRRVVVPLEAWNRWRQAQVTLALTRCEEVMLAAS